MKTTNQPTTHAACHRSKQQQLLSQTPECVMPWEGAAQLGHHK